MTNNFANIIKHLRKERGLTQEQFGKNFNITKTGVSYWESGTTTPSIDMVKKIAEFFDVPTDYLINGIKTEDERLELPKLPSITQIPLYSSISCGTGMFVDDNIEDYIAVPDKYIKPHHDYFANTACGDSMIGKGIEPGNVLIFEKANILDNGQIGAFCINDEDAVCKVFRKLSSGIILLESANPKYEPIEIDLMKDDCFKIVGKLVGSFRQY